MFIRAAELYPQHSSILVKFAGFQRHVKKDAAAAEALYKAACDANPNNADALGSYASFLHGKPGSEDHVAQLCKRLYPYLCDASDYYDERY